MLVNPRLVEGLEWRRLRRLGEVLMLVDSGVVKKRRNGGGSGAK